VQRWALAFRSILMLAVYQMGKSLECCWFVLVAANLNEGHLYGQAGLEPLDSVDEVCCVLVLFEPIPVRLYDATLIVPPGCVIAPSVN
jgi:hypothetical protein